MATYLPYFYPFWGLRWPIFLPFSFVLSLLRPLFPFRLFWVFLITFCVVSILENLVWIVPLSYDSLIVCFRLSVEHHWKKERSLKLEAQKKHIRESERALWMIFHVFAPSENQSGRSKYQSGRSDTVHWLERALQMGERALWHWMVLFAFKMPRLQSGRSNS